MIMTMLVTIIIFSVYSIAQGDKVCFDKIGCFSNDPPFNNAQGKLPKSPELLRTSFTLHSKSNVTWLLDQTKIEAVKETDFDPHHKTVIIVHGFHSRNSSVWVTPLVDELLRLGDMNVILVDWSGGAFDNYNQAVANTRVVGAVIAEVVNGLHNFTNLNFSNVHLIGHSLGAHICGYAGERISGLGRITGLDPAGPFFQLVNDAVRLDSSDANFVDAIHTDANHYGLKEHVGHVDFFPNGGAHQPGCTTDRLDPSIACSHVRAIYYFIKSINPTCLFHSSPCASKVMFDSGRCTTCGTGCQDMGYKATKMKPGSFYLNTNWHYPYCSNDNKI